MHQVAGLGVRCFIDTSATNIIVQWGKGGNLIMTVSIQCEGAVCAHLSYIKCIDIQTITSV